MQDSYGDGWNGNYLYFGDHSSSSTVKVTLPSGSDSTVGLSLPPGVYSPYACHGSWDGEITWTIVESGLSGGADNSCSPTSGSFTVNAQVCIERERDSELWAAHCTLATDASD
jgi:hypothetical protein